MGGGGGGKKLPPFKMWAGVISNPVLSVCVLGGGGGAKSFGSKIFPLIFVAHPRIVPYNL